jgi:hypothetical protein
MIELQLKACIDYKAIYHTPPVKSSGFSEDFQKKRKKGRRDPSGAGPRMLG